MPNHNTIAMYCFIGTITVCMILRAMSIFPALDEFNPDWVILALIYWSIALPDRFGVLTAFWVGLFTDVLTGHLLGQYALIYSLINYFSIKDHRRLRQFPLPQQCSYVLFLLLCEQILLFGMESMQAANRLPLSFWYPVLTGTLAWPVVFILLRAIRVMARISG